jgi:phage gp36-like protein
MAPYCTPEDLAGKATNKDLISCVSDDARAAWTDPAVQTALEDIIAQAQDQVDSAVGAVGTVPVDPVTAQVKSLTIDLAVCQVLLRRPPLPDGWADVLKAAQANLRGIAKGDIPLVGVQVDAPPPVDKGVTVASSPPMWGHDFWDRFR